MRVGLYFGSFNPIHTGHLIIASMAKHTTDLDQVWLMVTPQNPLKPSRTLLNEYQRLHLVRLAIEDDPALRASDIEFHLPKPSYTIDTLTYLSEKYPQHTFCIIMGSDSYNNLPAWKNYEAILKNYPIYIYKRPAYPIHKADNIQIIEAPLLEISSTQIRRMIQEGTSIRYLVHDKVAEEIARSRYYL